MSNEADAQTIQKTQKLLGKYIKKPPLTEKLLKKPPFRFLHDVVNNIIRETGFLKGLYSERELVSENVKDKDDKIAFLNKLIEATKAITGIELAVRASKVIAGLESAETNLLLQAIGTALDKKLDSSQYITQLKSEKKPKNQTNAQVNDKKAKHDKIKEKHEKQEDKKKVSTTTTKNAGKITDRSKGTKVPSSKDSMESTRNEKAKPKPKKLKEKTITPRQNVTKTVKEKAIKEVINEKDTNAQDTLDVVVKDKMKEGKSEPLNIDANNIPQEELDNELLGHGEVMITNNDEKNIIQQAESENLYNTEQHIEVPESNDMARLNFTLSKKEDEQTNELVIPKETKTERLRSARPKTALKTDREIVPPISVQSVKEVSQPVSTQLVENQNSNDKPYVRPRSSLRPPSVRPSSARPGAPRLRSDASLPEGEVIPLGKVNVIVESYNNKDLDEEETVTIQTAPEPDYQAPILQLPTDKGHLVEQILEQIQQSDVVEHTKPSVNIEWEQDGFRSRNAANKEIEQLKAAIQTLTRTANPLGKLVNYLHEDIEAMHSELDMWVNSARQIMVDVANQKRISDESNKPLQSQLEEIEDNIAKHQQQIVVVHGSILRNEQRIRDLLVK